MNKTIQCLGLTLALAGLSACASLSGTQTARTLKKGETQSAFGGGQFNSAGLTDAVSTGGNDSTFSSPYLEYSYRQGLTDKWDFGVKLTFIGTINADAKYNLYADDHWAFSVGGGLGFMNISSGSGDDKKDTTIVDVILPVYASYDFNEIWALYFIPKYIARSISAEGASGTSSLVGANLGVKWGKKSGLMFELGQFTETNTSTPISQAHVAWFWSPKKAWF